MHTHTGQCILCGSPEGDSVIYVKLTRAVGNFGLTWQGTGHQRCPACRAKEPMAPALRQRLDHLGDKLWSDLRRCGCPCCGAGLIWQPSSNLQ
jgi:hypothetical protein